MLLRRLPDGCETEKVSFAISPVERSRLEVCSRIIGRTSSFVVNAALVWGFNDENQEFILHQSPFVARLSDNVYFNGERVLYAVSIPAAIHGEVAECAADFSTSKSQVYRTTIDTWFYARSVGLPTAVDQNRYMR